MNQITETASFTLLAGEAGFDPTEERLRANVRATIEAVFAHSTEDGQPFHASGSLADWFMGSGPAGWVKRFHRGRALAQAFPGAGQTVGVVDEPVQNGVGECRVANGLMPVLVVPRKWWEFLRRRPPSGLSCA